MSLNDILGSAQSGLLAAQAALKTVSSNVANVGTPGYAREQVGLSTRVVAGQTSGVIAGEPARVADRFLENSVYRRAGDVGRAQAESGYLDRLQALLGAPGGEGGIAARIDAVSSAATALTGLANSPESMAAFVSSVQDAVTSLQQLGQDSTQLKADVESEVGYTVGRINDLLAQIHDLNGTVMQLQGQGRSTAGAADQRMQALQELSGLIAVTVHDQPDGRITLDSADGAVLLDRKLRTLDYAMPGEGVAQDAYPPIAIRFADASGAPGALTGEQLAGAASGGKLGGLVNLRDHVLPDFGDRMGLLFGGMAEALNAASNAATAMPPPASLQGRATGLVGTDRLGFTGQARFAVTDAKGTLVAATTVDFDALGAGATVNDAVTAINAGLGGAGSVALDARGVLTFSASGTGSATGVAIGQGTPPADRAGSGFAQFFGLNDIISSPDSALVASGLSASDPHGFAAGQTATLLLRDGAGKPLAQATLAPAAGGTMGDLVTQLNASDIGRYGRFALDARGRFTFTALPGQAGATLSIPSDSTDRAGTGRSFTALSGLTGTWAGLGAAAVRRELVGEPTRLPLAQLQPDVAVGSRALGSGDTSGALALVDALAARRDFAGHGTGSLESYTAGLMGGIGTTASTAAGRLTVAQARMTDAVNRRDGFSGVNLDEELAQMVVLQNSYSAAARVLTVTSQMYDTLLAMTQ